MTPVEYRIESEENVLVSFEADYTLIWLNVM